jgi:hypothetical protein
MSIDLQQNRVHPTELVLVHNNKSTPVWICGLLLIAFAAVGVTPSVAQSHAFFPPTKQVNANVNVLALSTSVNVTWNRAEVYLATVSTPGGAPQLAKLVDSYSPDGAPILRSLLIEHRLFHMALVRNPDCDATARRFFLAPGDADIFDVSARGDLLDHDAEVIPCFSVIHSATSIRK